jgi:hypothetical protein
MVSLSTEISQRATLGAGLASGAQVQDPGHRSGAAGRSTIETGAEGEQSLLTEAERAEASAIAMNEPLDALRLGRLAPGLGAMPGAASGGRARGPN